MQRDQAFRRWRTAISAPSRLRPSFLVRGAGELAAEEGKFEEARRLSIGALRNSHEVGDKESIPAALNISAWVCFTSARQAEDAVQLLGAAEGMRETFGAALPPRERSRHERRVAAIRDALNQERFVAA